MVSARIVRDFNRCGAIRTITLAISKAFGRIWHTDFLYNFKSYGISDKAFGLFFSFLRNRRNRVVLDGKYPVEAEVPKAPVIVLHFPFYTLMAFPMMLSLILLSVLMILFSTVSMIRHLICDSD